ncbi:unnamed protein product [Owenia fusiformis]|uniref:Protein arginine methyltransferase NDUFAF7 n=1 Tax=Owenia fusiformis TaxID=6347 RepID=A0A8J1XXV1_OWEFU|nr:unnamed protein product [Owenia fusiformis]
MSCRVILRSLKLQCYPKLKGILRTHGQVARHIQARCIHGKKSGETELLKSIVKRIKLNGPLSVADYMREVLVNPAAGYYMHRDVFGKEGDFITSPEISQIFGELLGVWCVNEWLHAGKPDPIQVVELGPGRGTLADDMLRVFSQFPEIKEKVSFHFVEVSPTLSDMQMEKLSGKKPESGARSMIDHCYKQCKSKHGPLVSWYTHLEYVPHGFSFYLAHEFFDALPIYKFKHTDKGWCEVLIDIDEEDGPHHLRFVVSRGPTLASKTMLHLKPGDTRSHVEVCPEGGILVCDIAKRLKQDGGFALIADYGHDGDKMDTFRGFRKHKLHDVLEEPGTADLTADVDFDFLARHAGDGVSIYGPISQEIFLHNMGIVSRLQTLLKNASPTQQKDLLTGYDMLANPQNMGERFKFMAIMNEQPDDYLPAGFALLQ